MKNLLYVITAVLVFSASSHAGGEKLIGTWKSNKGATVARLKIHTGLTPGQIAKISTVLGQMVFAIDAQTITMTHGNWKFVTKYKILSETNNIVTVEAQDPQTKKLTKGTFEFDTTGKGFWVPDEKIPGFKERFDKLAKEQ